MPPRRGQNVRAGEGPPPPPERNITETFLRQKPPMFNGLGDPSVAEAWIRRIDRIFKLLHCTDQERLNLAAYQLDGAADHWWEAHLKMMTEEEQALLTWDDFKTAMYDKYIPESYHQMKEVEFYNLTQGKMTVTEYDRAFCDMSRYAPGLVDTDVKKAAKFCAGLKHEIRVGLACLGGLSYNESLRRALRIEAALPKEKSTVVAALPPPPSQQQQSYREKRRWDGNQTGNDNKRYQGVRNPPQYGGGQASFQRNDFRSRPPQCNVCSKYHYGECRAQITTCYNCGGRGHIARECPSKNMGMGSRQNNQGPRPQYREPPAEPRGNQTQTPQRQQQNRQRLPSQGRVYALGRGQSKEEQDDREQGNLAGMGTLFDMSVVVLFDTGASHSFISSSCVDTLELPTNRTEHRMSVTSPVGGVVHELARMLNLLLEDLNLLLIICKSC